MDGKLQGGKARRRASGRLDTIIIKSSPAPVWKKLHDCAGAGCASGTWVENTPGSHAERRNQKRGEWSSVYFRLPSGFVASRADFSSGFAVGLGSAAFGG